MQGDVYASLEFDNESVERCPELRKRKWRHRPHRNFVQLQELHIDKRRGELVIFHDKRHGPAKVSAAEPYIP